MNEAFDLRLNDYQPWASLGVCLLIGALVGAQRETANTKTSVGLRDFILIAGLGFVAGWIREPILIVVLPVLIAAFVIAQRFRDPEHVGITTDLSALAVYMLCVVASMRPYPGSISLAASMAILLTLVLVVKGQVKKFFHETLTDMEFADTVRFLALIFVIYPLLPHGEFGWYGFFVPTQFWLFIVLASSISYVGYFLEKFLGTKKGLLLTGFVGGLASTTVATASIARLVRADGSRTLEAWRSATVANSIQFPRVLLLIFVVGPTLAQHLLLPFMAAMTAGLVFAMLIRTKDVAESRSMLVESGNPFALLPALKLATTVVVIILVSKVALAWFGRGAFLVTSAIGGLVDTDSIALAASNLVTGQPDTIGIGSGALLIAFIANALFKVGLAATTGSFAFAWRLAISFTVMISVGYTTHLLVR
jgi:uncharacterized membrane protein (DUF4010 family)